MAKRLWLGCVLGFGMLAASGALAQDVGGGLDDPEDRAIYTMGIALARDLETMQLSAEEIGILKRGLDDYYAKTPRVRFEQELRNLKSFQRARVQLAIQKEKADSDAYVLEQAKTTGAETLPSGLVFQKLVEGTGAAPTAEDIVSYHYHGTLRDGTIFDSSMDRGQAVAAPVAGLQPCLFEGIQRMKIGGRARFYCPSELGFGDRGADPFVKPGAALTYEIQLLEVRQ